MDGEPGDSVRKDQAAREAVVKVKRTYGRRKEDTDASVDVTSNLSSRQTRLELPKSSEVPSGLHSSILFPRDASDTFGWKEKLALIDKQFDEEDHLKPNQLTRPAASTHVTKDSSSSRSSSTEDESSGLRDDAHLPMSIPPISSQSDPPSPSPIGLKARSLFDVPQPTGDTHRTTPDRGLKTDLPSEPLGTIVSGDPITLSESHGSSSEIRVTPLAARDRSGLSDEAPGVSRRGITRKSKAGRPSDQPNRIKVTSNTTTYCRAMTINPHFILRN